MQKQTFDCWTNDLPQGDPGSKPAGHADHTGCAGHVMTWTPISEFAENYLFSYGMAKITKRWTGSLSAQLASVCKQGDSERNAVLDLQRSA